MWLSELHMCGRQGQKPEPQILFPLVQRGAIAWWEMPGGEFPGGSMVRTWFFSCCGPGFDPWLRNKDPASWVAWQRKEWLELPWLPMQGAQFWCLVGDLRSYMMPTETKKQNWKRLTTGGSPVGKNILNDLKYSEQPHSLNLNVRTCRYRD